MFKKFMDSLIVWSVIIGIFGVFIGVIYIFRDKPEEHKDIKTPYETMVDSHKENSTLTKNTETNSGSSSSNSSSSPSGNSSGSSSKSNAGSSINPPISRPRSTVAPIKCFICENSNGICKYCDGTGKLLQFEPAAASNRCKPCGGSGICGGCNGKGYFD